MIRRGRKEKEVVCAGGPAAGFASALREARRKAGSPTYRQMAQSAHYSGPALSQAANGVKLPTWPVTAAYLKACGVAELAPWENDWKIARIETKLIRARGGSPKVYPMQRRTPSAATSVSKPDVALTPREQILDMLNLLGRAKGLSLRAVASQTRICQAALIAKGGPTQTLSSATIHEVLSGQRPITQDFITIYLNAIGATPEEQCSLGEAIGRLEYKLHRGDSHRPPAPEPGRHVPGGAASISQAPVMPRPGPLARGTAPVPMPRAIGRASVPQPCQQPLAATTAPGVQSDVRQEHSKITADVLDGPIADTYIPQLSATAPQPLVNSTANALGWRATDPRVRCHRTSGGYHRQSRSARTCATARKTVLRAETVAGATIFGGLFCWLIAFAMTAVQHVPVAAAADLGSAVLIASGAITLTVVLLLLNTVLQDPQDSGPARQRRRARLRQWLYKGQHRHKAGSATACASADANPYASSAKDALHQFVSDCRKRLSQSSYSGSGTAGPFVLNGSRAASGNVGRSQDLLNRPVEPDPWLSVWPRDSRYLSTGRGPRRGWRKTFLSARGTPRIRSSVGLSASSPLSMTM